MKLSKLQATSPSQQIVIGPRSGLATQSSSASATYENGIFNAAVVLKIARVRFVPNTVVTGTGTAGAGATLHLNLWRAGAQVGADGAQGKIVFNTGVNVGAMAGKDIPLTGGFLLLLAGDTLSVKWTQGATGLALPTAHIQVEVEPAGL